MSESLRALVEKTLLNAKGSPVTAQVERKRLSHFRFARNSITTCGEELVDTVLVNYFDRSRKGQASSNDLSDEGLQEVVQRAAQIAKSSVDDPEFLPPLEAPQKYTSVEAYDNAIANLSLDSISGELQHCLELTHKKNFSLAGYLTIENSEQTFATSSGLFEEFPHTIVRYSVTARNNQSTRSGKASSETHQLKNLNFLELTKKAIALCSGGEGYPSGPELTELTPRPYVTILSPNAVADMLKNLLGFMDKRQADEGRSYFSKQSIGVEKFPVKLHLSSDPSDAMAPSKPYDHDGLPRNAVDWIKDGSLRALKADRFWAKKNNVDTIPLPSNLILRGGENSLDEMIKSTELGILVSHLWYIRIVDPQQALLTGLTRDGAYLIEDGKLVAPIKNLRFNESPVEMLKRTISFTPPQRTCGNESEELAIAAPWIKVDGFRFSSISDAV